MKYIIILNSTGEHMFVSDLPFFLTKGDRFQKQRRDYEVLYNILLFGEKQVRTYVREF